MSHPNLDPYSDALKSEVYDMLYPAKDYPGEAAWITDIVGRDGIQRDRLLDAACGTGLHLEHFQHAFSTVAGFDLNASQLARARQRLPESVELYEGSLETCNLNERFDVVTCLFAAINHMRTRKVLARGIATLVHHANPNGVVIVQPTKEPEAFGSGRLSNTYSVDGPNGERITRLTRSGPFTTGREGQITFDMFFEFIRRPGERYTFTERHEIGVYRYATIARMLQQAGAQQVSIEQPPQHLQLCEPVIVGHMPSQLPQNP